MPERAASSATGDATGRRPRPARAGGRVKTPHTVCGPSMIRLNVANAGSGVPAKRTRNDVPFTAPVHGWRVVRP